jgi:hypothetical protein
MELMLRVHVCTPIAARTLTPTMNNQRQAAVETKPAPQGKLWQELQTGRVS